MDNTFLDLIIKITPIVLGVIGTGRLLYELAIGTRTRIRDEYSFAKNFFGDLRSDPVMHPYPKEKGYQAIAGDAHMKRNRISSLR